MSNYLLCFVVLCLCCFVIAAGFSFLFVCWLIAACIVHWFDALVICCLNVGCLFLICLLVCWKIWWLALFVWCFGLVRVVLFGLYWLFCLRVSCNSVDFFYLLFIVYGLGLFDLGLQLRFVLVWFCFIVGLLLVGCCLFNLPNSVDWDRRLLFCLIMVFVKLFFMFVALFMLLVFIWMFGVLNCLVLINLLFMLFGMCWVLLV